MVCAQKHSYRLILPIAVLALLAFANTAFAGPRIAIIVNSQNKQRLSLQDITNIYNDKLITWKNGEKIDVYNLPTSSPAREVFSRALLGLSAIGAAAEESNRRITNTSRNPQFLKRERLVRLVVGADKNAIGYINAENVGNKKNLRVLFIIE